jgi:leucine dehydrogenase
MIAANIMKTHDYEEVSILQNKKARLLAINVIHDTTRGPAVGGIRFMKYKSEDEAIYDALNLARSMTYKIAAAGLSCGGGKTVILDVEGMDRVLALKTVARFIESLNGRRFTGRDLGISLEDLEIMRTETQWVADESAAGVGDLSEATACGVYHAMRACLAEVSGTDSFEGKRVAVQGVGEVGYWVAKYALEAGARVVVADVNPKALAKTVEDLKVEAVSPDQIYEVDCDVFSPCAVGGVLNSATIPRLRCKMVAGSANNVLGNEQDGNSLYGREIVYAPDYIANAGAVIQWWFRQTAYPVTDRRDGREVIADIYPVVKEILRLSREKQRPPARVADQYAESKLKPEKTYRDMNWGM